jgi:hypothetical protein
MRIDGTATRPYLRETLLALAVIALTFLNFGHVSVTAAGDFRFTPDSWCGDPLLPDTPSHAPCHACRVGGADLPPPPAAVQPIAFVAVPIAYAAPVAPADLAAHRGLPQSRGPPALA